MKYLVFEPSSTLQFALQAALQPLQEQGQVLKFVSNERAAAAELRNQTGVLCFSFNVVKKEHGIFLQVLQQVKLLRVIMYTHAYSHFSTASSKAMRDYLQLPGLETTSLRKMVDDLTGAKQLQQAL